jgi:hypothetical protein
MNAADFRTLIMTGSERHAEAIAEHTAFGIDRILNVSSAIPRAAATEPRPRVGIAQEGSSPRLADLGTAEVGRSSHERFVAKVRELLKSERFDDALSVVEDEFTAINGPTR